MNGASAVTNGAVVVANEGIVVPKFAKRLKILLNRITFDPQVVRPWTQFLNTRLQKPEAGKLSIVVGGGLVVEI